MLEIQKYFFRNFFLTLDPPYGAFQDCNFCIIGQKIKVLQMTSNSACIWSIELQDLR